MERITRDKALEMCYEHDGIGDTVTVDKIMDYVEYLEQQLQHYKELVDGEVVAEFKALPCKNDGTIISTSADYQDDILSIHEDTNNCIWLVANELKIINPIKAYKVLVIKQGELDEHI